MIVRMAEAIVAIVFVLLVALFGAITLSYYLSDRQMNIRHRTPIVPEPDCIRMVIMDMTYAATDECWVVERCKLGNTFESVYYGRDMEECSKWLSTHPSGGGTP